MKILILWTALSGYIASCVNELDARPDAEVTLVHMGVGKDTAYLPDELGLTFPRVHALEQLGRSGLRELASALSPDALICSGWHIPEYRAIAASRVAPVQIMAMDNQWSGSSRQRLAVLVSRLSLTKWFDAVYLPADRQARFAHLMGFRRESIWRGVYTADRPLFASASTVPYENRHGFVFAGRLVPAKGLDILADAYRAYLRSVEKPWSLEICGTGPLRSKFENMDGVSFAGFVQPEDLSKIFARSRVFLMPSRFEPWGIAIHEATCAGLPIVCTSACGAADSLVEDDWNGYVVPPGNIRLLTRAMVSMHNLTSFEWGRMSAASASISARFSPQKWATTLMRRIAETTGCPTPSFAPPTEMLPERAGQIHGD